MNTIKTVLLMGALTGLLVWAGDAIGGRQGMYLALVLAAGMNLLSYWYSDKIVLAMYRAQPVDPSNAPKLYSMVHQLAVRAALPTPRIYIIPDPSPNAFATGRDPQHAVVAVTEGIMRLLTDEQLEGVIAHELAHVRNRDMLIGAIAATMAGALMIIGRIFFYSAMIFGGSRDDRDGGGIGGLIMIIVAPIAAMLIQLAISRSREYQADASAAELTGKPLALAGALGRLEQGADYLPLDAQPATAHMFTVNPLRGGGLMGLFSTHPPIEKRIERLQRLAAG